MTRRAQQVASKISQLIMQALYKMYHSGIKPIEVCIAHVEMVPNFSQAFVYVNHIISSDANKGKQLVTQLNILQPQLRTYLAKHAGLRHVPELIFRYSDASYLSGRTIALLAQDKKPASNSTANRDVSSAVVPIVPPSTLEQS